MGYFLEFASGSVVNLKTPINEDMAANVSVAANNGFISSNTGEQEDENVAVELTKVNFVYTGVTDTTLIAGKMGVPTPWTVASDSDGAEQTGTGLVAINSSTPVTLVGAYFNQTNFGKAFGKEGNSIAVVGAKTKIAGLSLEAFYADQIDALDSYTVAADYSMDIDNINVGMGLRHTELEVEGATTDNELTQGYVKAKTGIFDAKVAYGQTGKDGGTVAFDASANTAMEGWNTNLYKQADSSYLQLHAGAQVIPTVNVALNWFETSDDSATNTYDAEEIYTQITYKPSKNFYTYVRLGQLEKAGSDASDVVRVQVQYSF